MSKAQIGGLLAQRRRARGISQLDLALRLGISQRHLGFVETGRAGVSKSLMIGWMEALEFEPSEANGLLIRSGFTAIELDIDGDRDPMHDLARVLEAHEPFPAFLFDASWRMRRINLGGQRLCALLMPEFWRGTVEPEAGVDMIAAMIDPGGLFSQMINAASVGDALLHQLRIEQVLHPEIGERVDRLEKRLRHEFNLDERRERRQTLRSLEMVFLSAAGRLSFVTAQFMAGLPQDARPSSLRMEVWFPTDELTRRVMSRLAGAGAWPCAT